MLKFQQLTFSSFITSWPDYENQVCAIMTFMAVKIKKKKKIKNLLKKKLLVHATVQPHHQTSYNNAVSKQHCRVLAPKSIIVTALEHGFIYNRICFY